MKQIEIAAFDGIEIGHAQSETGITGCTVILCRDGAVGGVDVRGGAPGTRETDLLNPLNLIEKIHAVVLAGGSAFGLAASTGVMEYLETQGIGFDVGVARVPIVCSAVLFDLSVGDSKIRPDRDMGLQACLNACKYPAEGSVGAGLGATVGKAFGPRFAMKGGLGIYCLQAGSLKVGAIVAVNCFGDVIDPLQGNNIIAGAYDRKQGFFLNTEQTMMASATNINPFISNTTIGTVITNAKLTKAQTNKVSAMAHNGYARTLRPSHTLFDGDTIFTMATGEEKSDVSTVGMLAAIAVEKAIIQGVTKAQSIDGYVSYRDIRNIVDQNAK